MSAAPETDAARRKRLLWRATHRGIKEMDIIFGSFVEARIATFTAAELDDLERMISLPDQELLSWATATAPVPDDVASPLLLEMLDLSFSQGEKEGPTPPGVGG